MDVRENFSSEIAKKIFGSKENALKYLVELDKVHKIEGLYSAQGRVNRSLNIYQAVVESWQYERSLPIIRELFRSTPKYKRGSEANDAVAILKEEWDRLKLGSFEWPFSQGDFDNFVQRINAAEESGEQKDDRVKGAAVKFRRIKEINTYRNDYIETMIFNFGEEILPTLGHRRGVDFFIGGVSFDQKVSRSVTSQFQKHYGDDWRQHAIENPDEVAKYLYQYQDEGRFGAEPRLLIVYIDEDVSVERIEELIGECDFANPHNISFTYTFKSGKREESFRTKCITILLYNN